MSASLLPPRSAEVADIMEAAKQVFLATLPKCLPLAMLSILMAQLASLQALATGKSPDLLKPHDDLFWVLFALGFMALQLLAGIIMLRQHALISGRPADLAAELQLALRRWPMLLLTAMLSGALMALGIFMLVVPFIYAFVCFLVLRPVVLFEPVGPLAALLRCFRIVRPRWLKFCAAAVIAALIVVVCALVAIAALKLLAALLTNLGIQVAAVNALGAAALLGLLSVAAVYFSALQLALYSVASSSA